MQNTSVEALVQWLIKTDAKHGENKGSLVQLYNATKPLDNAIMDDESKCQAAFANRIRKLTIKYHPDKFVDEKALRGEAEEIAMSMAPSVGAAWQALYALAIDKPSSRMAQKQRTFLASYMAKQTKLDISFFQNDIFSTAKQRVADELALANAQKVFRAKKREERDRLKEEAKRRRTVEAQFKAMQNAKGINQQDTAPQSKWLTTAGYWEAIANQELRTANKMLCVDETFALEAVNNFADVVDQMADNTDKLDQQVRDYREMGVAELKKLVQNVDECGPLEKKDLIKLAIFAQQNATNAVQKQAADAATFAANQMPDTSAPKPATTSQAPTPVPSPAEPRNAPSTPPPVHQTEEDVQVSDVSDSDSSDSDSSDSDSSDSDSSDSDSSDSDSSGDESDDDDLAAVAFKASQWNKILYWWFCVLPIKSELRCTTAAIKSRYDRSVSKVIQIVFDKDQEDGSMLSYADLINLEPQTIIDNSFFQNVSTASMRAGTLSPYNRFKQFLKDMQSNLLNTVVKEDLPGFNKSSYKDYRDQSVASTRSPNTKKKRNASDIDTDDEDTCIYNTPSKKSKRSPLKPKRKRSPLKRKRVKKVAVKARKVGSDSDSDTDSEDDMFTTQSRKDEKAQKRRRKEAKRIEQAVTMANAKVQESLSQLQKCHKEAAVKANSISAPNLSDSSPIPSLSGISIGNTSTPSYQQGSAAEDCLA